MGVRLERHSDIHHGGSQSQRTANAASRSARDGNDAGHVQSDDQLLPPEVHQRQILGFGPYERREHLFRPLRGQISGRSRPNREEAHFDVVDGRRDDEESGGAGWRYRRYRQLIPNLHEWTKFFARYSAAWKR